DAPARATVAVATRADGGMSGKRRDAEGEPPSMTEQPQPLRSEDVTACVRLLEAIATHRGLLVDVDASLRRRLLPAAGRLSRPERADQRRLAKGFRRRERMALKVGDERVLDGAQIRVLRAAPIYRPPPLALYAATADERGRASVDPELARARKCYVC